MISVDKCTYRAILSSSKSIVLLPSENVCANKLGVQGVKLQNLDMYLSSSRVVLVEVVVAELVAVSFSTSRCITGTNEWNHLPYNSII